MANVKISQLEELKSNDISSTDKILFVVADVRDGSNSRSLKMSYDTVNHAVSNRIDSVQRYADKLSSSISALCADCVDKNTALNGSIAAIDSDIGFLSSSISALPQDLATITAEQASAASQIAGVETWLSAISDGIPSQISGQLDSRLSGLSAVDSMSTDIQRLDEEIHGYSNADNEEFSVRGVIGEESNYYALTLNLNSFADDVVSCILSADQNLSTNISSFKTVGHISCLYTCVSSAVEQQRESTSNISSDCSALRAEITQLKSEISSLRSAISAMQRQIASYHPTGSEV